MDKKGIKLDKGMLMEELLKYYFRSLGYFAVRSIKLRFNDLDITDVDLWLYNRKSPISRERINVDIKNKKTPQAIERMFWARGLQNILTLDKCIVVTTDSRQVVVDYGEKYGVTVIDGQFLSRLIDKKLTDGWISDEDLFKPFASSGLEKFMGDWKGRHEYSKSLLLTHLNYDGCNRLIEEINYFMNQIMLSNINSKLAARLLYLIISYFLIVLDYLLSNLTMSTKSNIYASMIEGFRYGNSGKVFMSEVVKLAARLAKGYSGSSQNIDDQIRKDVLMASESIQVEILAEYFSTVNVWNNLFVSAKYFLDAGYSSKFSPPSELDAPAKAIIGIFADLCKIQRKKLFDILDSKV